MKICMIEDCTSGVSARKLCGTHYQRFRTNGTLDTISPRTLHSLTEISVEGRTAICVICGPVKARKSGKQWKCASTRHRSKTFGKEETNIPNGVLTDEVIRLMKEQNNLCGICNKPEVHDRRLALDHCHVTGKIRGLLCHRCNVGLGNFDDNLEGIRKAYEYLLRSEELTVGLFCCSL